MNGKSDPTSEPLAATFSAAPVWAASSLDRPARIALKPAPVAVATKVRRSVLGTSKPSREAVGSRFIFRLLEKFTSGQGSRCRGPHAFPSTPSASTCCRCRQRTPDRLVLLQQVLRGFL